MSSANSSPYKDTRHSSYEVIVSHMGLNSMTRALIRPFAALSRRTLMEHFKDFCGQHTVIKGKGYRPFLHLKGNELAPVIVCHLLEHLLELVRLRMIHAVNLI